MITTLSAVRNRVETRTDSRKKKNPLIPFSTPGIIAVLFCPVLLTIDVIAEGKIITSVLYLLVLTMLMSQRSILILMYAAIASIMMFISMRIFSAAEANDLIMSDKIMGITAVWMIALGMVRHRRRESNSTETIVQYLRRMNSKPKPYCVIKNLQETPERIANVQEVKLAFSRIGNSDAQLDEYTRDLTWFIYQKSVKN